LHRCPASKTFLEEIKQKLQMQKRSEKTEQTGNGENSEKE